MQLTMNLKLSSLKMVFGKLKVYKRFSRKGKNLKTEIY